MKFLALIPIGATCAALFAASVSDAQAPASTLPHSTGTHTIDRDKVPRKLPNSVLPDLAITASGETSKNVYYAQIRNTGKLPAGASEIYCAASIKKADGKFYYAIERVTPVSSLPGGSVASYGFDFNSGADSLKPGDTIDSVHFAVNRFHAISEVSYRNNDMRIVPGTTYAPLKP
jgi:hypothetical protein